MDTTIANPKIVSGGAINTLNPDAPGYRPYFFNGVTAAPGQAWDRVSTLGWAATHRKRVEARRTYKNHLGTREGWGA